MTTSANKPLIAISRCLLGDNVRYDAEIKHYPLISEFVRQHFKIIAVCPEVEAGLAVPRPAVQLSGTPSAIRVTGRDDTSLDITTEMQAYCKQRTPQLDSVKGYIFKSKSPSCGVRDIPLFDQNKVVTGYTQGVFAASMLQYYPELPITDEQCLLTTQQLLQFLQRVKNYQQTTS